MKLNIKTLLTLIVTLFSLQTYAQVLGSLDFNGSDSYINVVNSPLNEIGNGDFTFEAWIKGDDALQTDHPTIFSNRGYDAFDGGVVFFFHNQWGGSLSRSLCVQIEARNFLFVNNGSFNGNLLDNECHHIAITRSGSTLTFFADGILFGTTTPSDLGSVSFDGSLWIGRDKANSNAFNGIISQCRIWKIARTENEIIETKDISLQGDEGGLLAYWEMNGGTGQIAADKTGQYNGVLGNSSQTNNQDPLWSEEGCIQGTVSTTDNIAPSFKVFPNPTSGYFTLDNEGIGHTQIRIADQMGRLLLSESFNTSTIDIDISDYPKGLYLLSASYDNQIVTQKIIKL